MTPGAQRLLAAEMVARVLCIYSDAPIVVRLGKPPDRYVTEVLVDGVPISEGQWASLRAIDPARFDRIAGYEEFFGKTIQRKLTVIQQADKGHAYEMDVDVMRAAMNHNFNGKVVVDPAHWMLPAGAFGESCGPT